MNRALKESLLFQIDLILELYDDIPAEKTKSLIGKVRSSIESSPVRSGKKVQDES